ncbi:MAG: alanine dehydrogenase, partial [Myxococcota bacterium]
LERYEGGAGVLLGGVPGVAPGKVLILGGGVAGSNAAQMAVGLGADVTVVDRSLPRLRELEQQFDGRVKTAPSSEGAIARLVAQADLAIGTVLVPGAAAPKLVSKDMVRSMRPGSVVVDVAIDQGGCFETSRPTNHAEPTFVEAGVVHYCVTNMPGAVPRTSTFALTNATLPYVCALADRGLDAALGADPGLAAGGNVRGGRIVHPAVAEALGREAA